MTTSSPATGSASWEGALEKGVPEETAERIFAKLNGQYMFPESHSHAFAVTAYQSAWLKRYHPVEFFVSLVNNQPMGFYPAETLKQDARRFGVPFLNPCVNRSRVDCIPSDDSVLLGLRFIRDVGASSAQAIVEERERHGPYAGSADLAQRTGLKQKAVESLVMAGSFDSLGSNRRKALWEAGLGIRPGRNGQQAFPRFCGRQRPGTRRLLRLREDGGRVPGHGHPSQGTPDGVRAARPQPSSHTGCRRGPRIRGGEGPGGRLAHSPAAPQG